MKTPGTQSAPTAAPTSGCATDALILWRFSDGRRGHDAQSRGLAEAMARRRSGRIFDIPVPGFAAAACALLAGHFPGAATLPDPDFLIGAGRATHLPLLAARRARGGRAIVLMRPSLPAACFDACLIPGHDAPRPRDNVIVTRGPLNTVVPGSGPRTGTGLVLVGGSSRHYHWPAARIRETLARILRERSGPWRVTDSPRTPPGFRAVLQDLAGSGYTPWEQCAPDWLPTALAAAPEVWVTADSLSMIYEALTAGAAVGVIELPQARRHARAQRALAGLLNDGWLATSAALSQAQPLPRPPVPLAESERCADLMLERFSSPRRSPS